MCVGQILPACMDGVAVITQKCVDTDGDSDAEENEAINKLKQILEKAEPKSLITRFRCQYCNKSHYDKGVIDLHIIDDHSIPSTSKVNPRYKKSRRQKMQVSIPSNSVQKKYIEDYENYECNYFEDSSECLQNWDEKSDDRHWRADEGIV